MLLRCCLVKAVDAHFIVVEVAWIVPVAPLILVTIFQEGANISPCLTYKHLHESELTFNFFIWS